MPLGDKALAALRARKLTPTKHWEQVWQEEHGRAFVVAQMAKHDQLLAVHAALEDSLRSGMTKKQFVNRLSHVLEDKGWAPKGRGGGIPYRLARVFSVNRRVSHAAGKWHTIQETKKVLPYLLYSLGPSATHRDAHVALNGTLLPADDPFWQTHFPPNGWGCKCRVRQVGQAEYDKLKERKGISTTRPVVKYRNYYHKIKKEWLSVPVGIDPGWGHNPGASPWDGILSSVEIAALKLPPADAKRFIGNFVAGEGFESFRKRKGIDPEKPDKSNGFPIALLGKGQAAGGSRVLKMEPSVASKQLFSHRDITQKHYLNIQTVLESTPIVAGEFTENEERRVVRLAAGSDGNYVLVWAKRRNVLVSFYKASRDEIKFDKLVTRLEKKVGK